MGITKRCVCGHTKGSHAQKNKHKDRKVIKYGKGRCLCPRCDCKKYKEAKKNETNKKKS